MTSLSATPTGKGYWIFTNQGRVFPFGDAVLRRPVRASTSTAPVLSSVATPTGKGYYMVASDGGVFAFGDAMFRGSMGATKLNEPVESLVPDAGTAWATGWWPPTAASSPSGTPPSGARWAPRR